MLGSGKNIGTIYEINKRCPFRNKTYINFSSNIDYLNMDSLKKKIIKDIEKILKNEIDRYYIIGSFQNEKWDKSKSDIDIICIDHSFENFQYSENLKYIKNLLIKLPFKFDIFVYTWDQLNQKIEENSQFKKEVSKAIANGKV